MDENMNPITEQAESAQVENGGQDPVVADQEPAEVENTAEGGAEEGASGDGDRKQTHAENAAYKRMRQRAEREAREQLQREYDERISKTGIINPYTGEQFRSVEEFEQYGQRFRADQIADMARQQNRPVEQLQREAEDRELANQKRREDAEKAKQTKKQKEMQQFIQEDAAAFVEEHPEVDLRTLTSNKMFLKFCGSRYGREPLSELYEDFLEIGGAAAKAAVTKAQSKQARGVGGGGSTGGAALSADQQGALERWNRDHPEMKMTAKEFMEM
ncbi:MAG: hypothetical protein IJV64_00815 [Oscillospiraceae bacterium]|nr:hypothetical protein [Oscillospiraceae bacterium]